MTPSSDFEHPGKLFLSRYGRVTEGSDVVRYARFLRDEAGLDDQPPVDLLSILHRFGISSKRIPLKGPSGFLLNPDHGVIFISSDDASTRQRFTEAHELMELLFAAQSNARNWPGRGRSLFSHGAKERLCERGAAELLMPLSTVKPRVWKWGVSLDTGKRLAGMYDVSLTAALLRAVQVGPGHHALVLWRLGWKPIEQRNMPHPSQMSLFSECPAQPPPKKLRVRWASSSRGAPFIPPHKSIESDTSIHEVYETGVSLKRLDWIDLETVHGSCLCESMAITLGRERHVLSLIHLPRDEHSHP